jgi:hypothetical protein
MFYAMKQIVIFLLFSTICWSQSDVPLTLSYQFNGKYGYTIIGNTHNNSDNFVATTATCPMLTSSEATLNLNPNQNIVGAFLYWSGIGNGSLSTSTTLNGIPIIAENTNVANLNDLFPALFFSSYKDITPIVQQTGNGLYTFANFDLNSIISFYCSNTISYSGWNIIIVYEDLSLPSQQLNIYTGFKLCGIDGLSSITIPVNNLNVIDNQNAKMSYVVWKGSAILFLNESILFNGNILSNALNPPDNPFNSTNSFTGSTTNWNQDIDTFDISSAINIGDTQANITFNTFFLRFFQNLVTSIRSELPDATVQINQVTGQNVCNNRDLVVTYTVQNTNSNAVLPANVPVSFYANNIFLQTVNTPSSIAIGGSLALQTTLAIPAAYSQYFYLAGCG